MGEGLRVEPERDAYVFHSDFLCLLLKHTGQIKAVFERLAFPNYTYIIGGCERLPMVP